MRGKIYRAKTSVVFFERVVGSMKKVWSVLFGGLCAFAFASCGQKDFTSPAAVTMTATVVEVRDSGLLLVESGAGADSAMTVGLQDLPVYDAENHPISIEALRAGQQLELCYDGSKLETFPCQLPNCEYLKLTGQEMDVSGLLNELRGYLSDEEQDPMPVLQVEYASKSSVSCTLPMRGTASWNEDGYGACQDSPHPLAWRDEHLRSVITEKGNREIKLLFSKAPQSYVVTKWAAADRGDTSHVTDGETVEPTEDGILSLDKGGWLYEVAAAWEEGAVTWAFLAE